jgi:hypothetical protein
MIQLFHGNGAYLPPHEDVVRLLQLFIVKLIRVERLCILVEGLEFALEPKYKIVNRWNNTIRLTIITIVLA